LNREVNANCGVLLYAPATIFAMSQQNLLTVSNHSIDAQQSSKKPRKCDHIKRQTLSVTPSSSPRSTMGTSEVFTEAITFLYHRFTMEIEYMIDNKSADSDARHQTVRAIQAISLLNRGIRSCTMMTPRVAAVVFYQLRCKRPTTFEYSLPYNDVPWVLKLSTPLSLLHGTQNDTQTAIHPDEFNDFQRAVAKIARAPPPNPRYYYERRLISGDGDKGERRLRASPLPKCPDKTWDDALSVILQREHILELETAPAAVHAFVSSVRARHQKDMQRTSKSRSRCVNRTCKRCFPCGSKPNDFNEQLLFHLFPKTERHDTRYWLAILNSYTKSSIGPVSFCSNLCFEQIWVPRMKETLGSTMWTLNTDDTATLEPYSTHRVHAVLHQLVERNKQRHVEFKQLLDRDQRSATCLRERDVKSITELMMYALNIDTIVVVILSQLRATDITVKDPCPHAWRAKLSNNDLYHYIEQACNILDDRICWKQDSQVSLIHTPHDMANLQARCQTHVRKHKALFVRLGSTQ